MVHTCPRCELRFEREAEVRDHLVQDHRFDVDALRPHPVPAPKAGRRLVVAIGNHTLLADVLREALAAVVAGGDADVHIVVPVRDDAELEVGLWRGRTLAERIVQPGVDVTVDAGVGDPVALMHRAAHGTHIDHVIVSVLPTRLSRWTESDLAGRLRHELDVPVDVVTAEG